MAGCDCVIEAGVFVVLTPGCDRHSEPALGAPERVLLLGNRKPGESAEHAQSRLYDEARVSWEGNGQGVLTTS